ncbi:IS3 family transposase [Nonomuraea sp. NPDC049028]|uniref:IS3 family transposase n=1 Tax=Nonomuraea sp. NPDC049028 TaxID=3364348 RepID=UPI003713EACF
MTSRFRFISAHTTYGIARLCRVLNVGRSAFYAWRKREPVRQARAVEEARIVAKIRSFHADSGGTNGSPRITADLRDDGEIVNVKRVARLMRAAGIVGLHLRKGRRTTIPDQAAASVPDLLQRDVSPGATDERWCGDIPYLPVDDSWLYLATVIDIGSRRLIGWSIAGHLRTELISDALTAAMRARGGHVAGVIFHTDRGCQGGFNRCSQHFVVGGVGAWAWARNSRLSGCIAVRSPRRDGRLSPGDRIVSGSGKRSLEG